jgi:pimeloyl-ACP methyl ester carboxylesterase
MRAQDADHWVHFEKPNEFCNVVETFLRRMQS